VEDDFHVFGIKWTPDVITFLIEDKAVYRYAPISKNGDNWPFNKPFYLLLNVAIGGNFGGPVGQNTAFPQEFLIDYVRVYQ
jgi:beta-glucanase (GH16 family)